MSQKDDLTGKKNAHTKNGDNSSDSFDLAKEYREMERQRQSEKLIPPIQMTGLTNSEFVKRARLPMMPEPTSLVSG